jgi:hypothetical protein
VLLALRGRRTVFRNPAKLLRISHFSFATAWDHSSGDADLGADYYGVGLIVNTAQGAPGIGLGMERNTKGQRAEARSEEANHPKCMSAYPRTAT